MKKADISKLMSELGRQGGKARLAKLTKAQRVAIAKKASQKAAELRSAKAKANKS